LNPALGCPAICAVVFAIPLALLASSAAANGPLQIYGLQLDTTHLGDRLCEARTENDLGPFECKDSGQSLPKIAEVQGGELPAPNVTLTFKSAQDDDPEKLTIWYLPRNLGGQSFLISTTTLSTRGEVLRDLGDPTVEFSPADLESRGLHVMDLTLDTLLFVDPNLPKADRDRMGKRLKTEFDPSGDDLFFLRDSSLETLARLLGSDFRGAIVQVAESGFGHHSYVTTILVDLRRAAKVFNLAPEGSSAQ
jgi:hypothetical protein